MHITEIDRWCDLFEQCLQTGEVLSAERFLVSQGISPNSQLLAELQKLEQEYRRAGEATEDVAAVPDNAHGPTQAMPQYESVATVIGPFKLLQKLGEGGMGVVYLAEQMAPVVRRVALKIIKPGMDSRQVLARFAAERQALAMMDHPNIARVLDAGTTPDGRPYFVMELVKGIPITRYCDGKRLTPRERLDLFVPICQAIQHAHHKGVIHRDLKPANVLIAELDDQPVPKIIDFGLAKAISQPLTEQTVVTQFGQIVGTIDYMSPEQASFNELDVDTRTDVYSLGVLLYELLTGETPFDRKRLRQAALDELLRIIRQEEPRRPSMQLSGHASLPTIAANRRTEPKNLCRLVHGELDWIVMKALEKERARRYETPGDFAQDVRRYLDDEPVGACPPSASYRLRKLSRKHRAAVLTVGAFVGLLLAGTVVSSFLAIRATRAEESAKREAAIAKAVNDFLNEDLLAQSDPRVAHDQDVKLQTVLDRAAERVEGRFANEPLVEAALRQTIGVTYFYLGKRDQSDRHLTRALELRSRWLGQDHRATLQTMHHIALLRYFQGRQEEAAKQFQLTFDQRQRTLGPENPDTLESMICLELVYDPLDRAVDYEPFYKSTLSLCRNEFGDTDRRTLVCMHNLAILFLKRGRLDDAERLFLDTLAARRVSLGDDDPHTAASLVALGRVYDLGYRYQDAEQQYVKSLEIQRRVLGDQHVDTLHTMTNLAFLRQHQGRYSDAIAGYEEVLKADPENFFSQNALAWLLGTCPEIECRNTARAIQLAERGTEIRAHDGHSWQTLGVVLYYAGEWPKAIDALSKSRQMLGDDRRGMFTLAMAHDRLGQKVEARHWFEKAAAPKDNNVHDNEGLAQLRAEAIVLLGSATHQKQP